MEEIVFEQPVIENKLTISTDFFSQKFVFPVDCMIFI
jgi:hypothetical protein